MQVRLVVESSPLDKFVQDFLQLRVLSVLLANLVDNLLDHLVTLALLLEVLAGLVFGNLRLELI